MTRAMDGMLEPLTEYEILPAVIFAHSGVMDSSVSCHYTRPHYSMGERGESERGEKR